jgi:hypothetical protein
VRSSWRLPLLAITLSLSCYGGGDSNDSDDAACEGAPATAEEFAEAVGTAICEKTDECHGSPGQEWIDGCVEDYVTDMSAQGCDYDCEAAACVLQWASDFTCDNYTQDPPCPFVVDCD